MFSIPYPFSLSLSLRSLPLSLSLPSVHVDSEGVSAVSPTAWAKRAPQTPLLCGGFRIARLGEQHRGRIRGTRKSIATILEAIEWCGDPQGGASKLGLLIHFLEEAGLRNNSATDRASHLNTLFTENNKE